MSKEKQENDHKMTVKARQNRQEQFRDRGYTRWAKNLFSMHSSSWLVNPDRVCIPLAVALTPIGLNQTGGYFKLRLSLASARKCVIVRQKRNLSVLTVGVKKPF